jgi:hypothetical protein
VVRNALFYLIASGFTAIGHSHKVTFSLRYAAQYADVFHMTRTFSSSGRSHGRQAAVEMEVAKLEE